MFPAPIPYLSTFTVLDFEVWVLVLVRVSILVFMLPVIGASSVSPTIKAGLSALLSFVIYPTLPPLEIPPSSSVPQLVFLAFQESAVGILIGTVSTVVFMALTMSGRLIDFITGFSMAQSFNPLTDESESVMGQIQVALFSLLLLVTGGHLVFVEALAESFQAIPPLAAHIHMDMVLQVTLSLLGTCFIYGIKLAAPMLIPLLLTTVGLAIVARIMPQMNVWLVGMPLKIFMGLGIFSLALPLIWSVYRMHMQGIQNHIPLMFKALGAN